MESTRKLKAFIMLTLIFISVFTIDWYGDINKVRVVTDDEDVTLSSEAANSIVGGRYNSHKTYFWRKKVKKTVQNTAIPFVYKTVILSESKYKLYSI